MSNRVTGSVTFDVEGAEFTLKLSTNAMCELEDEFDQDIETLFNSLDPEQSGKSPRIGHMRKIVKAMLSDAHPDLSLTDVGNVIDQFGLEDVFSKVEQAVQLAFPDQGNDGGKPEAAPAE